jgi:hypothetical protein
MAALDSVGDYEADPNVMMEDVPQDIVIKTLKVSCACVPVWPSRWMCGKFSVKYMDDPNWWTHSLVREGYGKDKHWVAGAPEP